VLSFFRAHRKTSLLNLLFSTCKRYRDDENVHAALDQFNLRAVSGRLVTHLSLGEKRRMEIAMAVLAKPKVLLLDEPLAGLAESEIKGVLDVLRKQVGKQTIVIVEHKISHVKDFLERLIVMHEGRIIAEGGYEECLRHPEVRKSYWQIDTAEQDDGREILHDH
jgi:ABC-type branched-subunit amino acid transport system ATPase component